MEKFTCFIGASKDSGFPKRLVYEIEQGGVPKSLPELSKDLDRPKEEHGKSVREDAVDRVERALQVNERFARNAAAALGFGEISHDKNLANLSSGINWADFESKYLKNGSREVDIEKLERGLGSGSERVLFYRLNVADSREDAPRNLQRLFKTPDGKIFYIK